MNADSSKTQDKITSYFFTKNKNTIDSQYLPQEKKKKKDKVKASLCVVTNKPDNFDSFKTNIAVEEMKC